MFRFLDRWQTLDTGLPADVLMRLEARDRELENYLARGPIQLAVYATADRPDPSIGVGMMVWDSDLSQPIWSDGTDWLDATGAVV